jgi:antitoxin VapB
MQAIRRRVARLPELDSRSDEEIIGYDEHGIPN